MNDPEPDVALRAVALLELGRLDESERMAGQVLAIDPNSYVALVTLAAISMQRLDEAGLIGASRRLIGAHPDRWDGYWFLCTALNYQRQWDEAIEAGERAVALAPAESSAFHELARALAGSPGRIADAIRTAEEGARLGPNEVWSWVLLSGVRRVAGQFAEAVSAAKRALSIEPSSTMGRVMLGVAHLSNGDHDAATEQFRSALRQEPIPYTFSAVEETLLDHAVPAATRLLYEQVRLALGHPDLTDPDVTTTDPTLLRLQVAYSNARATRNDLELDPAMKPSTGNRRGTGDSDCCSP